MNETTVQKINQETENLKNAIDQLELTSMEYSSQREQNAYQAYMKHSSG